jgi:hypothetical protein
MKIASGIHYGPVDSAALGAQWFHEGIVTVWSGFMFCYNYVF